MESALANQYASPGSKSDVSNQHEEGQLSMSSETEARPRKKIVTIFGTRPEVIKLAPVLKEMAKAAHFQAIAVNSGQHLDLLDPFVRLFGVQVQHDLMFMSPGQNRNQL